MKQRVKSAIILVAIALSCVLLSEITRILFLAISGILCAYEYSRAVEKRNVYCCAWVMYLYLAVTAVNAYFHTGVFVFTTCYTIAVYLALFSGILHRKVDGLGSIYTLAGVAYPCFLFSLLMVISVSDVWVQALVIGCFASWICDAFAMFGGSRFGKHKVAPHVSPNKTVEGCLTGALSSIVTAVIIYFVFPLLGVSETLPVCLITCLLASTLGQIGDLAESLLKRTMGIKDFSNLIPGHGGIFDRSDSLLFAIPTAYLCLKIAHM